jgi:hypothetical protein
VLSGRLVKLLQGNPADFFMVSNIILLSERSIAGVTITSGHNLYLSTVNRDLVKTGVLAQSAVIVDTASNTNRMRFRCFVPLDVVGSNY